MENIGEVILFAAVFLTLCLLLHFLRRPLRLLVHFGMRLLYGGILLILGNTFLPAVGVNLLTAAAAGILGVPGALALFFVRQWY